MAVFLLVRSVFVALTLIAPSPIDPQKPAPFFNSIFYGGDLFFSGHTGLPFMAALAFWHIPQWRTFYLALTAFFGSIVFARPLSLFHRRAGSAVHHPRRFSDVPLAVRTRLRTISVFRKPERATAKGCNHEKGRQMDRRTPPKAAASCYCWPAWTHPKTVKRATWAVHVLCS